MRFKYMLSGPGGYVQPFENYDEMHDFSLTLQGFVSDKDMPKLMKFDESLQKFREVEDGDEETTLSGILCQNKDTPTIEM